MYTVYILYSEKIDRYYIGFSSNVTARLRKHNNASKGFTNAGRPWVIVYTEQYDIKQDAAARERQLEELEKQSPD